MKPIHTPLLYLLCASAFFCVLRGSAHSDVLDGYPHVREQIENYQQQFDPNCERARNEKAQFTALQSKLMEQLCSIQTDKKECFYQNLSPDEYFEKVRPLTQCESILGLTILEMRNLQLQPALKAKEGRLPELQPIATWNYPSFGALVLPISEITKQYVIVFNRATFTALLDLLKSMVAIIPIEEGSANVAMSYDRERIAIELDHNPDIMVRVSIQLANIIAGRANEIDLETLPLNTNQLRLAGSSLAAVELFMLAHEYGHQHYNHYKVLNDSSASQRYDGLSIAQEKEVDADLYARDLLLRLAEDTFAEFPIDALVYNAGAEIFFAVEELLTNARDSVGVHVEQSSRYPHIHHRRSFVFEAQAGQQQAHPHLFQVNMGEPFRIAADVLWDRISTRWPLVYRAINELKGSHTIEPR